MSDEQGDSITESLHPEVPNRTRVMLLGYRNADRELVTALQRLGAAVIAVDDAADTPLHRIADRSVAADVADTEELSALLRQLQPNCVVIGTEVAGVVAVDALTAGRTDLVPGAHGARLTGDLEAMRRLAADQLGLPTVPFWFAGSADELRSISERAGFPMVVRPVAAAPGEGRSVMLRPDDVDPAWQFAMSAAGSAAPRVLAEAAVDVDYQVTLLTVCSHGPAGRVLDFCAPIGHRSIEGRDGQLVLESWQPQAMTTAAADAARSIAARIVRALDGRGVFGVELLIRGNEVYFSDVAGWPSDTALLTRRTQRLSACELQARAILGLPIDTIMVSPGAARLTYSAGQDADAAIAQVRPDAAAGLAGALSIAESDVTVFVADHRGYPRRRLGVAMATASEVRVARHRAAQVAVELDKAWSCDEGATV